MNLDGEPVNCDLAKRMMLLFDTLRCVTLEL